jgi:hypothetical protein
MQDSVMHYSRGMFVTQARTGAAAPRRPPSNNPPGGIYPCQLGNPNDYVYLLTSRANPEHWTRLLKLIGREDLTSDARGIERTAYTLRTDPHGCPDCGHRRKRQGVGLDDASADRATAWEPENGIERTAYTLLADLLTGIGFALLLVLREPGAGIGAIAKAFRLHPSSGRDTQLSRRYEADPQRPCPMKQWACVFTFRAGVVTERCKPVK